MEESDLSVATQRTLLFIVNDLPYFVAHWKYRSIQAAQAGYRVHVAAPAHALSGQVPGEFHALDLDRKSIRPDRELRSLSGIFRLIQELRPSLIHAITAKPNLYAGVAARCLDIPAVLSVTGLGTVFSRRRGVTRMAQRCVLSAYHLAAAWPGARVLFENPDDLALFLLAGVAPPSQLIEIPGSGVDVEVFAYTAEPSSEQPVVLLAARMLQEKGVEEFVIAARALSAEGCQARFVLVGTPDAGNPSSIDLSTLQEWAAAGDIEWWGHRSDMPATLQAASIVCLPSYREGIPRVLIEAAACGRPLVSTDVPGCREICRHGVNGLLVPARDPIALAGAIRCLLADSTLRREMGARGRELVEKEYRQEIVTERTLAVYRTLEMLFS